MKTKQNEKPSNQPTLKIIIIIPDAHKINSPQIFLRYFLSNFIVILLLLNNFQ